MRHVIHFPLYRALNTTLERKDAFKKYCDETRRKERVRAVLELEHEANRSG